MRRFSGFLYLIFVCIAQAQTTDGLKVFISVDMEGITGIAHWEEVSREGKDYDYFRQVMTRETNAAIQGALSAGATNILVRDSHGSARNILPEMLDENARLLRSWGASYKAMMECVDETFDAVLLIGYHAKAGTPNALLEHTMSGDIADVSINGVSLPEAGLNALIAGHYDVPVVFVSGDKALCDQAKDLFGNVKTVAVKEGIGNAALNLHPEVARTRIREGVTAALRDRASCRPFRLKPPYRMVLRLKKEELVQSKSFYPGARRTGNDELTFESNDILEVIKAFEWMH